MKEPLLAPACAGFYTVNPGCFLATSHDLLAALRHWNLLDFSLLRNSLGADAPVMSPVEANPAAQDGKPVRTLETGVLLFAV